MSTKYKDSYLSYALMFHFYFFALGIFSSIMSIYLTGIDKSASEISFVISSAGIFSIFTQPIVGYCVDKTQNSKLICTVTLLLAAISGIAFMLVQTTIFLFLLNGLTLSFINAVSPINEKLATSSKFRYGTIRVWGAIGYALASQIAAVVYVYISPVFNFVLFFFSLIISLIGYYGTTTDIYKKKEKTTQQLSVKEVGIALLKNNPYLIFLVVSFIFTGTTTTNNTYLPLLITENGGSVALVGTIMLLATLVEVPIIMYSYLILDKLSNRQLLIISFVSLIIQFSCYSLTSSLNIILLSAFLLKSVVTMLFIMITLKIVISIVEPTYVNSALGIAATVKALGGLFFQISGGFLVDVLDITTLYFTFIFVSLLGLLLAISIRIPSKKEKVSLFSGKH